MVHAETTNRSTLDADHLIGRLHARGVAQLRDEAAIWVLMAGSDVRQPHAQAMEALQRVKRLTGQGTVPGYRTRNARGVGCQRRGRLDHRRFSSEAVGFLSESAETQAALAAIGQALAPRAADITDVFDAGFDDVAVWAAVWTPGHHLVCRVQHRDRLVQPAICTTWPPDCNRWRGLRRRWSSARARRRGPSASP
jgi:hypothetical protein